MNIHRQHRGHRVKNLEPPSVSSVLSVAHSSSLAPTAHRREYMPMPPQTATAYNSRFFFPGSGWGYMPLASASKGAGESAVILSMPGANSCSEFSI